jgi:hypothetical protein
MKQEIYGARVSAHTDWLAITIGAISGAAIVGLAVANGLASDVAREAARTAPELLSNIANALSSKPTH